MSDIFKHKTILLGATGGVAVYKAIDLASKLTQAGAAVDVVMTPAAMAFVTPLAFSAVTHRQTYFNPWESDRQPEHIALAERPDLVILAPATANTMAKVAHGIADNLLTEVILATKKPILIAPAMNVGMWEAPATRRNLEILRADGRRFVGPGRGMLACGYEGVGRMSEPKEIMAAAEGILREIATRNMC